MAAAPDAGFCTVVAFFHTESHVCGASSGDSAEVLLHGDKLAEVLADRQHKNPPVGSQEAVFVPFAAALGDRWCCWR